MDEEINKAKTTNAIQSHTTCCGHTTTPDIDHDMQHNHANKQQHDAPIAINQHCVHNHHIIICERYTHVDKTTQIIRRHTHIMITQLYWVYTHT